MLELFIPDLYQQSVYTINYDTLKDRGIKCLLFDLDNTLTPFDLNVPTKKTKDFIKEIKEDFKVFIFSNSPKKRVDIYKEELKIDAVFSAMKPFKKKFLKLLQEHDLDVSEVAIIGDQLLTDILGGNRVGLTTVLVNPVSKKDIIFTNINRKLENGIYKKLHSKGLFLKGKYYE